MTGGLEAKMIKGIWFPKHDKHLSSMVENHSKIGDVSLPDGRVVGSYQLHKLRYAMNTVVPPDRRRVAVDVGGHIGLWSMHLAGMFEEVHAFEPLSLHRSLFGMNVTAPNVTLHHIGLGEARGSARIVLDHLNTGNAHVIGADADALDDTAHKERRRLGIVTDAPVETETVDIAPLDEYAFDRVDLVKIDVEGYEIEVVKGARETLLRNRPAVVIEQKGNEAKFHGQERNAAGKYLQSLGAVLVKDYGGDWIMKWPG